MTYREQATRSLQDHNDSLPSAKLCGMPRHVSAGGGDLIRTIPCPTPGWWSRLWNTVAHGDIWRCDRCRKKYRWTESCGWAVQKDEDDDD